MKYTIGIGPARGLYCVWHKDELGNIEYVKTCGNITSALELQDRILKVMGRGFLFLSIKKKIILLTTLGHLKLMENLGLQL